MPDPANDVEKPLTPLVFLCAAIRAECADAVTTRDLDARMARVLRLVEEIERHAEEERSPVHVTEGEKRNG